MPTGRRDGAHGDGRDFVVMVLILRRGPDPDPAWRWPTMDALLDRLGHTQRRSGIVLASSHPAA